ncbi:hypothetical protein [Novipirellula artificiosorum]|uniref:LTXXQ motif protein n=1 Tax=Novipirellula artificiosorum TaxID=2528016 RepID=A0A5C6E6M5_9BACT|nr:hypothetical protein [Novipirellula artificiosorum]TWU42829.1 hypothetical protein Poly41_11300 [Novipirellula artificiosorum]
MKMKHIVASFFAVAALALMVGDACAQGGRGGGPGGGGPGGGGFGGRGGGPGGGESSSGEAMVGLLRIEEVRAECELMPDQEEALKKIQDDSRTERPDFDFRNASEAERTKFFEKMQEERAERAKKIEGQLDQVLMPAQMKRLKQIALQVRGVGALSDPEIQKELEVTDAQKKEMEEVRTRVQEEIRSKMQELMQSGDRDREAMQEAFSKVRTEIEDKVLAVLTSDQKAKFEEMKGEAFKMPEGVRGGGFMGRGGAQGGQGRGGAQGGQGRGGAQGGQGRGGAQGGQGGRGARRPAGAGN